MSVAPPKPDKPDKPEEPATVDPAHADEGPGARAGRGARRSAAAPSPFPPIADFAFLSNCHTSALVAPDGGIGWMCVPCFDAPSVFATLLDREAGSFRIGPFGIVVHDALTMGPRRGEDTVTPHTRSPADIDGDHVLVRMVECIGGSVEIELVCEPVFDYGSTAAEWVLLGDDRHAADAGGAGLTIRLQTDMALGIEGGTVRARHQLHEGEKLHCALSWAEGLDSPSSAEEAEERLEATTHYSRGWLNGARYTWIRDSTFTLQALHYMNLDWEADEFMQYIADLETDEDGGLQIMYGIDGRRDLMERLLWVASPLGLFAEEFDTETGRHLGNFPQAFSHLALIEAGARIILAERLEEFA